MDGKPSIILGLVWTIIMHIHVSLLNININISLFMNIYTHGEKLSVLMFDFSDASSILFRLKNWPAHYPSVLVSLLWSRWRVWTLVRPTAVPAAVQCHLAVHPYMPVSAYLPRKPCCCGSESSARGEEQSGSMGSWEQTNSAPVL